MQDRSTGHMISDLEADVAPSLSPSLPPPAHPLHPGVSLLEVAPPRRLRLRGSDAFVVAKVLFPFSQS